MKIWVLISLLMVYSGERVAVGYPEDSVPEPAAADGASDPGSATTSPPATPVEPQNSQVGNAQPLQGRRPEPDEVEEIECYQCITGIGGENKLCENVDEVGLRASSGIASCKTLKPEGLEGNLTVWEHAERCVVIKGDGWKKRQCMDAKQFLSAIDHENWKKAEDIKLPACKNQHSPGFNQTKCDQETLAREKVRFGVLKKNMDGFRGPECKTYGDTEICSCRGNLCNSSAINVPLASFIIILFSALFFF